MILGAGSRHTCPAMPNPVAVDSLYTSLSIRMLYIQFS